MSTIYKLMIALALLSAVSANSQAAFIALIPNPAFPIGPPVIPFASPTCTITRSPTGVITYSIDPQNVQAFQLDVSFNPANAAFLGITYVAPYVQSSAPDLSQLASGLVQDIAGTTTSFPPPSGDVDIFSVSFQDLRPNTSIPTTFSVFASSNDYVVAYDTDTQQSMTLGPSQIGSCEHTLPEPGTYALMGLGGLMLIILRRRSQSVSAR